MGRGRKYLIDSSLSFFFCPVPYFSPQPYLHHFFREINSRMHLSKNDFSLCFFGLYKKWKIRQTLKYQNLFRLFCEFLRLSLNYDLVIRCLFVFSWGKPRGGKGSLLSEWCIFPLKKENVAQGNTQKKREAEQQGVFFCSGFFPRGNFLYRISI